MCVYEEQCSDIPAKINCLHYGHGRRKPGRPPVMTLVEQAPPILERRIDVSQPSPCTSVSSDLYALLE